jgi:hypothetical protein
LEIYQKECAYNAWTLNVKTLVIILLHIELRGELIKGAVIFNNLVENSLYPYELFGLRVLIIFSISVVVVGLISNVVYLNVFTSFTY